MSEKLLERLERLVKVAEQAKLRHKAQWQTNIAFFNGYQYSDYTGYWGLRPRTGKPAWKVQLTCNYVRAAAMLQAAKLTQNRPGWAVLPATQDDDDIDRARASRRLLDYYWERQRCQEKTEIAVLDSILTGQGYLCGYWDPEAGEEFEGGEIGDEKLSDGITGFPSVEVATCFEVGHDPLAPSFDQSEWGYRKRLVSLDWLERKYGIKLPLQNNSDFGDELVAHDMGAAPLQTIESASDLKSRYTTMIEFYDVVKKKAIFYLPESKRIVKQFDWPFGMLPFVQIRAIPNRGDIDPGGPSSHKTLGQTTITDVIELQRELNRTLSQLIEIKNMLAFPRILASRSAAIDPFSLLDRPGSQVLWSGIGPPPMPLHLGNIPSWVFQFPSLIIERIKDVSGVHEVTQGRAPGSVQSGLAVRLLAEQDNTRYAMHARSISDAIQRLGNILLAMSHAYMRGALMLRIVGRSGELEVEEFKRSDLAVGDVYVQPGSTFARNKDLRNEQLMQIYQIGLEADPRKIKRAMEIADVDSIIGDMDVHRLKQRRELKWMLEGKEAPVLPEQDDFIHLDELTLFMNGTRFERLAPNIQQIIRNHYDAHRAKVQAQIDQERQAASQRGVAAAGAPGGENVLPFPANGMQGGGEGMEQGGVMGGMGGGMQGMDMMGPGGREMSQAALNQP